MLYIVRSLLSPVGVLIMAIYATLENMRPLMLAV